MAHPELTFDSIEPAELKARLDRQEKLRLIDVREQNEWDYCRIDGGVFLPLSELHVWGPELKPDGGPYVIYCHHGVRSRHVCQVLAQNGVRDCINLIGGIDLWSQTVDPDVPVY